MKVNFALDEIFGRNPKEVGKLFKSQGINPNRPYRARVTFNGVFIEQEAPSKSHKHAEAC